VDSEPPAPDAAAGDRIAWMSGELTQFANDQNRRRREFDQQLSSAHYRTVRANLLLSVLTRARAGTLTVDWRDTLALRPPTSATAAMFNTGDELAVREIATLAPAAWEPHSGAGWRTALENWHDATNDVYTTLENIRQENDLAHRARIAEQRAAIRRLSGRLGWVSTPESDPSPPPATSSPHTHRLHIDVWYQAGLAAGGEPVDWIGWLTARGGDAARLLTRIEADPAVIRQLEHLPDYWLNHDQ
jgi:hypothetical protein